MDALSKSFDEILLAGTDQLGLSLNPAQLGQLATLVDTLLDWNQRMNLTAVKEPQDVAVKHILDSMTCFAAIPFPPDASVLDVGTGAGFPGLVLKIVRPDLCVKMMDSTHKKLTFVAHIIASLALINTDILFGRAEELARCAPHREAYDIVVARAVAPLRILSELCIPFTKQDGTFLAMKGPNVITEIPSAGTTIARLGGSPSAPVSFCLPFEGGERAILPIQKIHPTPQQYPRLYRDIRRQPL
jgi:16S rRNA (guanine527-N7)-methyltransferase